MILSKKVMNVHLEDVFAVLFVCSYPLLNVLLSVMRTPMRDAPARKFIHPLHEYVITGSDDEMMNDLLVIVAWFLDLSWLL